MSQSDRLMSDYRDDSGGRGRSRSFHPASTR